MTGNELRDEFLRFFADRQHKVLPSYPLVLPEDPSTLFTVAGMQPFSPVFRGEAPAPAAHVATSQKVFREGDVENVGVIGRYHTFYEMLGNFSFGDYFKKEAVQYAWDFVTGVMKLPPESLWFTVYEEDEETAGYWQQTAGVSGDRIVRLGKKDNWWPQVAWNGPCGPCSEIYLDRGTEWGCGSATCQPGCDCDRFLEFWNLVFQMYIQDANGAIVGHLPRYGIDTGMGLERAASLVMNVASNYETDLVLPVTERLLQVLREDEGLMVPYFPLDVTSGADREAAVDNADSDVAVSGRVRSMADHIRAAVFLISDGVLPSAEGRGSVLRRLIRRSFGNGWRLGVQNPFLYKVVPGVIQALGNAYPEIIERRAFIEKTLQLEEDQFRGTVQAGMLLLQDSLDSQRKKGLSTLDGSTAFTLATTHGFPSELTRDVAAQFGFQVDWDAYHQRMEEHRVLSKDPAKVARGQFSTGLSHIRNDSGATGFLGYGELESTAHVLGLVADGRDIESAGQGEEVLIVVDRTPFYAESGGQVGDSGLMLWEGGRAQVLNTTRVNEIWLHQCRVLEGAVHIGDEILLQVDADRRSRIMRNHTATHLMHAALHQVLGQHATQAGSLVAPDRLRFDFTHPEPLSEAELAQVEALVQGWIDADLPVVTVERPLVEARQMGAMALFGEKYGDRVRTVTVGLESRPRVSLELCGGTHVSSTGVIGLFHVIGESGVGAGLRRLEAMTGPGAVQYFRERNASLQRAASQLRCSPNDVPDRLHRLQQQFRDLQRQRDALLLRGGASSDLGEITQVGAVSLITHRQDGIDPDAMGKIADQAVARQKCGVAIVASVVGGSVLFVCKVSPEALKLGVHAGNLVKALAMHTGGGGGGRPDFAQAGGKNASLLDEALAMAPERVVGMIAGARA